MINNILLKKLRNNEFIQFIENIQEIVSESNPETLKVQDQYNALNQPLTTLQQIHSKKSGSSITNQLIEIDKRRDTALISIYNLVEAYTNHFNEEVAAKASDLLQVLDIYGKDVARYSYQYETNAIDDILAQWESKTESIAAISITDWVNELKEANTLFNSRYLDRVKESAEESDIKVIEMRHLATEKYNELVGYLSAYSTIEKTEIYTKVLNQINALIDQYNKTLTARLSKKSSHTNDDNSIETEIPENTTTVSENN